jgi:hypothetical protein
MDVAVDGNDMNSRVEEVVSHWEVAFVVNESVDPMVGVHLVDLEALKRDVSCAVVVQIHEVGSLDNHIDLVEEAPNAHAVGEEADCCNNAHYLVVVVVVVVDFVTNEGGSILLFVAIMSIEVEFVN